LSRELKELMQEEAAVEGAGLMLSDDHAAPKLTGE
jgi:hypothetical protein